MILRMVRTVEAVGAKHVDAIGKMLRKGFRFRTGNMEVFRMRTLVAGRNLQNFTTRAKADGRSCERSAGARRRAISGRIEQSLEISIVTQF